MNVRRAGINYLDGVDVGLAGGVLLDVAPLSLLGRESADDLGPLLGQPLGAQAPDLHACAPIGISSFSLLLSSIPGFAVLCLR
jgi:hypothetical protein